MLISYKDIFIVVFERWDRKIIAKKSKCIYLIMVTPPMPLRIFLSLGPAISLWKISVSKVHHIYNNFSRRIQWARSRSDATTRYCAKITTLPERDAPHTKQCITPLITSWKSNDLSWYRCFYTVSEIFFHLYMFLIFIDFSAKKITKTLKLGWNFKNKQNKNSKSK